MAMRKLGLVSSVDEDADPSETRLKVAIATHDGKQMNAHFGSARKFMVYEVTPTRSRFLEMISFESVSDESGTHREDDRLGSKITAIRGCKRCSPPTSRRRWRTLQRPRAPA